MKSRLLKVWRLLPIFVFIITSFYPVMTHGQAFTYNPANCSDQYQWLDPPASASPLPIQGDDAYAEVDIGFTFMLFDIPVQRLKVSANGYLTFGDNEANRFGNNNLQAEGIPFDIISPFWDDLKPVSQTKIYAWLDESSPRRRFIVQWNSISSISTYTLAEATISFEVLIYEGSDEIVFQYKDVLFDSENDGRSYGLSASVGIRSIDEENQVSSSAYSYNEQVLSDGLALCFTPLWNPAGPYLYGLNPAPGTLQVSPDTGISFHIRSEATEIDIDSIVLKVQGVEVTSQATITPVDGDDHDILVVYDPATDFADGEIVQILIEAADSATPANTLSETYSFTVFSDMAAPYLDDIIPAPGKTQVPAGTSITFHIRDDGAGVDPDSIVLTVQGIIVIGSASVSAVDGDDHDILVTYDPPSDFANDEIVNILVEARDLSPSANELSLSYQFTTIIMPDNNQYELASCSYQWLDTPASTSPLAIIGDDTSAGVAIGFSFLFFGRPVQEVKISSNGYLTFGDHGANYSYNNNLNLRYAPYEIIAPFWDDLMPVSETEIYAWLDESGPSRRFIVRWDSIGSYATRTSAGSFISFEAILYEGSNKIIFQYKDVAFDSDLDGHSYGISASVGIRSVDEQNRVLSMPYSYNENQLSDELAICFTPLWSVDVTAPYFSDVHPEPGTSSVPADTSITFHVKDDGEGVDSGSIQLMVQGFDVTGSAAITPVDGDDHDLLVVYDPDTDFADGEIVQVTITAKDLAAAANAMPGQTYQFTVATIPEEPEEPPYESYFFPMSHPVTNLVCDMQGNVWLGTDGGGLMEFDPATESVTRTYTVALDGLSGDTVTCMVLDHDGYLWIGTTADGLDQGGITRFDPYQKTVTAVYNTEQNNFPDDHINDLKVDEHNTLWVATQNSGVVRLTDGAWQVLADSSNGLSTDRIEAIVPCGSDIWWIDGNRQVYKAMIDGVNVNMLTIDTLPLTLAIESLFCEAVGKVWVATDGGIFRYAQDGGSLPPVNTTTCPLLSSDTVYDIFIADNCHAFTYWLATDHGISAATADFMNWQNFSAENSGLTNNQIYGLAEDMAGNLWFGSPAGLTRIDPAGPQVAQFSPTGNDADPTETIILSFSEPMDPDSVLENLSLWPAVPLSSSWNENNTVLTLTPVSSLDPATTYVVTLNTQATTDQEGNSLCHEGNFSFTFTTSGDLTPPEVAISLGGQKPDQASLTTRIYLSFTEPMEPQSTEEAISFYRGSDEVDIPYTLAWNEDYTSCTISSVQSLDYNTGYIVEIRQIATDLAGNLLPSAASLTFKTKKKPQTPSNSGSSYYYPLIGGWNYQENYYGALSHWQPSYSPGFGTWTMDQAAYGYPTLTYGLGSSGHLYDSSMYSGAPSTWNAWDFTNTWGSWGSTNTWDPWGLTNMWDAGGFSNTWNAWNSTNTWDSRNNWSPGFQSPGFNTWNISPITWSGGFITNPYNYLSGYSSTAGYLAYSYQY